MTLNAPLDRLRPLFLAVLALSFACPASFAGEPSVWKGQGDRYSGDPRASRSAVIAPHGIAATSQPLATQVALDAMKAGGNAVDAAIAANAALGLMEPTGNGIGGDLFAIVWDPRTKKLYGLNGSGRAPMGQDLKALRKALPEGAPEIPDHGWRSVTIPGTVDAWFTLHGRFGKRSMAENLAPAISYACGGFPVTELIAFYWKNNMAALQRAKDAGVLEEFANAKSVYLVNGSAPREGEMFRNPDLAATLSALAKGGRDAFYNGPLADAMDAYFRRIGAPHRKADFAAHHAEWVEPLSTNYRGYDVWELPPNGQGIAALQMLNILEGYDLKKMGWGSADLLHVMAEAKKLVYEDRARFYADPAFYRRNVTPELLSKDYAASRRALIHMDRALTDIDPGDPKLIEGDTIYMTVADASGMMVSLIQSNYRGLGSGLVPDGVDGHKTLGFMFQDRGAQFSLEPGHPNVYAPGKRPFHTIIPAFVTKNGEPFLSFGVMGGDMQPQGHVQILVNMIDFGMGVQAAGDAARFHHLGRTDPGNDARLKPGGLLELESGFSPETVAELKKRGHNVSIAAGPYGGYQAIQRDAENKVWRAASEFRKDGQAAGY